MINSKNKYTDLVLESTEIFMNSSQAKEEAQENRLPPGVVIENAGDEEVKITRIRITSPTGEASIGKPMGNYITLEVPSLKDNDTVIYQKTIYAMANELKSLIPLKDDSKILIIGLGNWNVTPDALGPKVISHLMVTKHLLEYLPDQVDKGIRPVSAISPGVLGITGIETGEIVLGIVEKVKPDVLIAIDALAAKNMQRVNTTIQIADTGIAPGSGVGNKRMEISKNTVNMPVIAIGVPTVVDAATMASETIDLVLDSMIEQAKQGTEFYNMLKNVDRDEKYGMIKELLEPYVGNLIVTPKEIDDVVKRVSKVIANGLNMALHKGITLNDVDRYVN